jgi:hypothetical protein
MKDSLKLRHQPDFQSELRSLAYGALQTEKAVLSGNQDALGFKFCLTME